MQDVLDAILQINILLPPKEYTRQILAVLCTRLGYVFGIALAQLDGQTRELFAEYAAPPAYQACCGQGQEDRFLAGQAILESLAIQGVTRIPLAHQDEVLGVYELYAAHSPEFSEEDQQLLAQVGELAAVAISSNQYLERLTLRTRELKEEIGRRERMETALREALRERKALEDIINRSPLVVLLWQPKSEWPLEFISRSVGQFGYVQDALLASHQSVAHLLHPDDRDRVLAAVGALGPGDDVLLEFRLRDAAGDYRWVEMRVWPRLDMDGIDLLHVVFPPHGIVTHYQGILQDITERKQAAAIIEHQALFDALTDLPNRQLFLDRVTVALRHAARYHHKLGVLFLDLDHFKFINDSSGHEMGDALLKAVADRLRQLLRAEDTIARLGGDEFAVLLPELRRVEDASHVAQGILGALRPAFVLQDEEVLMTASLGITLYPDDGQDAAQLLRNADTALFYAKEQGRNNFQFFTPSMNARTLERFQLESALRQALERDELILHYQPQVGAGSGQVTGVESLLRWQHPVRGLIPPSQFIPLAEETGLIEPIGEWVLRQVCAQAQRWRQAGFDSLTVAVNLSPRQFYQRELARIIARVLQETGLPPTALELEITEGTAMRDVEQSIRIMEQLRAMQVSLSMDDFGVGYSSLMCLKRFPIDTLKIDKSFIDGVNTNARDTAIVTAIITMAKSMNLHVIAEGVETEDQLAFLRQTPCDGIQGYLFSKPLPAEAFERLITHSRGHQPPVLPGGRLALAVPPIRTTGVGCES